MTEDIRKAIAYEIGMLAESGRNASETPRTHAAEHNMALESFLIHYRNLRHFLFPDHEKPADILARDFSADWKVAPRAWPAPDSERQKLNARLFHLSTLRRDDDAEWDLDAMARRIGDCLDAFWASMTTEEQRLLAVLRDPIDALQHVPPVVIGTGSVIYVEYRATTSVAR